MSSTEHAGSDAPSGWDEIARAAEDFARRVARDAAKFAARLEEHTGELARDVSRDWRRAQRHYRRARRAGAAPEARRVFEDIRGVLSDVLDGVDELMARVFAAPVDPAEAEWLRLVTNRDATCSACGRDVTTGNEVYARRTAAGMDFRCLECGAPPPPQSADSAS